MKSIFAKAAIICFVLSASFSQTSITYSGSGGYSLVERTDLRRYENGKYKGLTSREVRSFISPSLSPDGSFSNERWYDGSFYVNEETLRNSQSVTAGIHDSIPSIFRISENGRLTMVEDNGYPSFRSFPSFPTVPVSVGERWNAMGERAVDPLYKGIFTRIPIYVQYEFVGSEVYKGEAVYRIRAMWQTNYGANKIDRKGDAELIKALGGHKADIIVRQSTGEAILVLDNVDETFVYKDGLQVQFKGKITLFTEFPPAVEHEKILPALAKIATVKDGSSNTQKKAKDNVSEKKIVSEKVSAEPKDSSSTVIEWSDGDKGDTSGENSAKSKKKEAKQKEKGKKKDEGANEKQPSDDSAKEQKVAKSEAKSEKQKSKDEVKAENLAKITEATKENEEGSAKNNMIVEETPAGIRLSMRDIRFKADSDEVLPSESYRLDEIAKVLKMVPDSQFLVEGHTAAVGKPQGEKTLSEQRAHKIAEELAKRGIPAGNFITRGMGGTKPVASNATESGRAQNRRVEITILE